MKAYPASSEDSDRSEGIGPIVLRRRFAHRPRRWTHRPMRLPSFSIAAIDGYLLRQIDLGEDKSEIQGAAGIFLMVNKLATAFRRTTSSRDRTGPLLVGIEIGATLAILAYLGCLRWWPEQMDAVFVTVWWRIEVFCDP